MNNDTWIENLQARKARMVEEFGNVRSNTSVQTIIAQETGDPSVSSSAQAAAVSVRLQSEAGVTDPKEARAMAMQIAGAGYLSLPEIG